MAMLLNYIRALYYCLVRLISFLPSRTIRYIAYSKLCGMEISKSSTIHMVTEVRAPNKIVIKENSIIGNYCILDGREGLIIGKNVNISSGVYIWTQHHDLNSSNFDIIGEQVVIGDFSWVCSKSVILPGVKIGKGAVVASGAVVTKDVEDWSIVAGVPAKKIGDRVKCEYKLPRGMAFY